MTRVGPAGVLITVAEPNTPDWYAARDAGTRAVRRQRAWARWQGMLRRCYSETCDSYRNYGGRGIGVCAHWRASFDNYYADTGDAPAGMSLDRIDNDGNYEPGNVRWATPLEQTRNRRHHPNSIKTHCKRGHEFSDANTRLFVAASGRTERRCRACARLRDARYRRRVTT